jgi:hypothetical protein
MNMRETAPFVANSVRTWNAWSQKGTTLAQIRIEPQVGRRGTGETRTRLTVFDPLNANPDP